MDSATLILNYDNNSPVAFAENPRWSCTMSPLIMHHEPVDHAPWARWLWYHIPVDYYPKPNTFQIRVSGMSFWGRRPKNPYDGSIIHHFFGLKSGCFLPFCQRNSISGHDSRDSSLAMLVQNDIIVIWKVLILVQRFINSFRATMPVFSFPNLFGPKLEFGNEKTRNTFAAQSCTKFNLGQLVYILQFGSKSSFRKFFTHPSINQHHLEFQILSLIPLVWSLVKLTT